MAAILAVLAIRYNVGYKKLMHGSGVEFLRTLWLRAETRYTLDLPQVVNWIENNGPEPKTLDANFSRPLHTLRTRKQCSL